MELSLDLNLARNYSSDSQKIRVSTEAWVDQTVYCPNCGKLNIDQYPNNKPVADFFCSNCNEDYELKSKKNTIGSKIVDGAYGTMIDRLQSSNNPNFFILNYNLNDYSIINFLVIPKHYFVPEIIEKRKPLALTARRAGWIGCNILLQSIPDTGKIFYVRNGQVESKERVLAVWKKTLFLREEKEYSTKGWLLDMMRCIDKLGRTDFTLDNIYAFEDELKRLHPENMHIKEKIRQQLQVLRDKGYLEFTMRGQYRLI
jgi:type II restriction enzyme